MQRNRQQDGPGNLCDKPEEYSPAKGEQHKTDALAVQSIILQMRHRKQQRGKEDSPANIEDGIGVKLAKNRMARKDWQHQPRKAISSTMGETSKKLIVWEVPTGE